MLQSLKNSWPLFLHMNASSSGMQLPLDSKFGRLLCRARLGNAKA